MLSVVLNCPIAIKEVINLGHALHAGKTTIKEVTNEIDNEEASVEEEQIQKKKVLNLINQDPEGRRAAFEFFRAALRLKNKSVPKRKIQEKILNNRTKIFDAFKQINLREKQITELFRT